jgi:hypothetical protein
MAAAGHTYDGLGLVCIDTYNAATSLNDDQHNRVGSTQAIFNMLRKLAQKHRCCIVVVDQPREGRAGSQLVDGHGGVGHAQSRRLPFELKTVTLPHLPLHRNQKRCAPGHRGVRSVSRLSRGPSIKLSETVHKPGLYG